MLGNITKFFRTNLVSASQICRSFSFEPQSAFQDLLERFPEGVIVLLCPEIGFIGFVHFVLDSANCQLEKS